MRYDTKPPILVILVIIPKFKFLNHGKIHNLKTLGAKTFKVKIYIKKVKPNSNYNTLS